MLHYTTCINISGIFWYFGYQLLTKIMSVKQFCQQRLKLNQQIKFQCVSRDRFTCQKQWKGKMREQIQLGYRVTRDAQSGGKLVQMEASQSQPAPDGGGTRNTKRLILDDFLWKRPRARTRASTPRCRGSQHVAAQITADHIEPFIAVSVCNVWNTFTPMAEQRVRIWSLPLILNIKQQSD